MCFNEITTLNLVVLSFINIKNTIDKSLAAYVLCMSSCHSIFLEHLLAEKTKTKFINIYKNDKYGVIIQLTIKKESGVLQLSFQKHKHLCLIKVFCLSSYYELHSNKNAFVFENDCNLNWVKVILFEFDSFIINYIRNFSGKNKKLKEIIQKYILHDDIKFSAHIDIPGYVLII